MARIRTVKPEFWTNEPLCSLPEATHLLAAALLNYADDYGYFNANPFLIKAACSPLREPSVSIPESLASLAGIGYCQFGAGKDGRRYGRIVNFDDHQRVSHPARSKIKELDIAWEQTHINTGVPPESSGNPPEDSASPPEPLRPEGNREQGTGNREQKRVPTEPCPAERDDDAIQRVFDHWRTTHGHPRSILDDKRRKLIRARLKDYTEADLCQAITGYLNSPHHMGQNDRSTVYDDISLLLKDSAHIDAGLRFYADPPRTDLSATTRKNVAAVAGWRPPEERDATG